MIKFIIQIREALGFCNHKWEVIKEINVWDDFISKSMPVYKEYVLRCINCGNIKKRTI